jgi:hypothetical protein
MFGKLDRTSVERNTKKDFLKKLLKHTKEVDEIFEKLVEQLRELVSDFGKHPCLPTGR